MGPRILRKANRNQNKNQNGPIRKRVFLTKYKSVGGFVKQKKKEKKKVKKKKKNCMDKEKNGKKLKK